jgi:hypothetical protein
MLWGAKDSPEEGELLIAADTMDEAMAQYEMNSENWTGNPKEPYTPQSIQSRYLAQVIPVDSIRSGSPQIYMISFAPTSKWAFGSWAKSLFLGNIAGFPQGTPVAAVVTRMKTVERQQKNSTNTYIAIDFEAVDFFKP